MKLSSFSCSYSMLIISRPQFNLLFIFLINITCLCALYSDMFTVSHVSCNVELQIIRMSTTSRIYTQNCVCLSFDKPPSYFHVTKQIIVKVEVTVLFSWTLSKFCCIMLLRIWNNTKNAKVHETETTILYTFEKSFQ